MPEENKPDIETKMDMEEGSGGGMMANYVLDFETLDAMEEFEEERGRLMKRGAQMMRMLEGAGQIADLDTIRQGMQSVLDKMGGKPMKKKEAVKATPIEPSGRKEPPEAKATEPVKELDPIAELKERGSFQLYKEGDSLRWLAVYSNKFRDNDNPPEIISEASHKNFVDMVDKGLAKYPELWYWHIPGTRLGAADYLAYDDSGFSLASGTIDKEREAIAKNITKEGQQLVSHGMPTIFIKRDSQDPSIITEHITTEISVLPAQAAANKLTNFIVGSEVKNMSLPEDKAQALEKLGFNVDEIQQGLEAKAQTAINSGVEFKEAEADTKEDESILAEVESELNPAPVDNGDYVSRSELLQLIGSMGETIKELKAEVKNLQTAQAQDIEKQLSETPAASLTSMWQSVIGSEEAKIDGRTSLAKSGPEETAPQAQSIPGVPPAIAQLVNNSRQGWKQ